jgi:hypothetical protein
VQTTPGGVAGLDASAANQETGLRGWLLVYVVALVFQMVHGLALTIGSIVFYTHPSLAGSQPFVPLGGLLFYVATNLILAAYTVVLLVVMAKRRRAAIAHNIIFNLATILFVVSWHVLGQKSVVGLFIDSLPGLIGLLYISRSDRVRRTFTVTE